MARVLVVDDDAQVRALVARVAFSQGHSVETASDGAEALDLLKGGGYDLLIIDNLMPKISGEDAVAILRASQGYGALKILMLSGETRTGKVNDAFEAGVNGFIAKPFTIDRLVDKLSATLL